MRIFTSAAPLPNAKSERLAVYDTYQICAWIFRFGIAFAIAVLADIYLRIFTTAMFGKAGKKYADKIAQHVSVFRLRGVFVLVLLAFIDFGSRRVSRLLSVFFFHHAIANNYCHRITVVRSFHCAAVNNYCHYYVTYLYVGGASSFEAYELQDAGINRAGH